MVRHPRSRRPQQRLHTIAVGAISAVLFAQVPAAATGPTAAQLGTDLCAGGGATVTLGGPVTDASAVLTVTVDCTATLDLNGHTLTVSRVMLGQGADLTIRDTSASADGELIAEGKVDNEAGIRTTDATLRIESGNVAAAGGEFGAGIGGGDAKPGGTVTVSGGTVTATGGRLGAGIGGGYLGSGGTVTVSGGTVTAAGGSNGAGIGGGEFGAGGTVTVSGGTVDATGGSSSAGIGGGREGVGGTVNVTAGTVTADGGEFGAGIGGGDAKSGGTVTVSGGTVTVTGGSDGAGVGGGRNGSGGTITISSGTVTATSGFTPDWYGIGGGDSGTLGDVTIGPGLIRTDTESTAGQRRTTVTPVPQPESAPESALALSCAPSVPVVGGLVTCTVTGGGAGIDILWRAAYNPTFDEAGVTLGPDGTGTFSFMVPEAALGEQLMVELVGWTAPMSVGVAGGRVPGAIPAGSGSSLPAGRVVLLLALVGLTLAVATRRMAGMTA